MVAKGEFPTRDNCDLTDPEEAFLWCFAALPTVKGAPLLMPVDYYRQISKHLWELGVRPVEEPTKEWVAPSATDPNWLTSPGKWVPAGSAPRSSERAQAANAVEKMSMQQRAELLKALQSDPFPDTPAGRVASSLSRSQRSLVAEVLKEQAGA